MANRVVEIRSYTLKPESRTQLDKLMAEQAIPMLERWKVDVVAYGASLNDDNAYFLMRSYADTDELQQSQDAFYGSDEWRGGPREPILALIETYQSIVVEVDEATLKAMRSIRKG